MDREAWWAKVHGVTKSRTQLSDFTFTFPVVKYGCESWIIKKAECQRIAVLEKMLESPMDRGAWWAMVHRVAKSWT